MTDKAETNAPHASAPRWGTWEDFVAWFMKQPDDRVFDGHPLGSRTCGCAVAQWLTDINGHQVSYNGADKAWLIKEDGTRTTEFYAPTTRFHAFAGRADVYHNKTKKELLDLIILNVS